MTNSRTILIPLDHLVSEVAAYPFTSTSSLEHGVWEFDPGLANGTLPLWRDAEREITHRFPHTSIDELVLLRNMLWFGVSEQSTRQITSLVDYLAHLSRQYLSPRGPAAVPQLPPALHGRGGISSGEAPDPAARRAWRWLTFSIPADLLLAGLRIGESGPVRTEVVSPGVDAQLIQGFPETHLHLGVAFDFPTGWAAAVNIVGRAPGSGPKMNWDAFHDPGADHDEGKQLASWLVRAAIVRYLLGAYLASGITSSGFRDYLEGDVYSLFLNLKISQLDIDSIRLALNDLEYPNGATRQALFTASEFARLQAAYNRLTKVSLKRIVKQLDGMQTLDPLSHFFEVHPHSGPSVQLQFLWAGLAYLEEHPEDSAFAKLFWQAERVRCQVYRHCIQRPLTPGLTNFRRFYGRKGAFSKLVDPVVLESAGVLGGVRRGLKSLEVRTSPESNRVSQFKTIRGLQGRVHRFREDKPPEEGWNELECGLVLHFLKVRGKDNSKGRPHAGDLEDHADPGYSSNTRGYRWQSYFMQRFQEAETIGNALSHDLKRHVLGISKNPPLLTFLRGIDVCSDEPGVPTWVVAPLFHRVQQRVNEVRTQWRSQIGVDLPPLRTTVHVGEDFVHLASGVRFMDEAICRIPLGAGDRVGHGLALGIDAKVWARRSTRLTMPREDRFFDLVWERHWHAEPDSKFTTARKTYVEDEIVRLARAIFGPFSAQSDWTVHQAIEFVCQLHNFDALQRLGFPRKSLRIEEPKGIDHHLERYLTSQQVYRECRTVEWVEAGRDGEAVEELQRLVRRRYANLGITIEVNPISNLLVGDLSDLQSHPLWRLAPGLRAEDGSALRMCVGSDDPFPFATTLPEEYQFLFDSLVMTGRSQAEAIAWIKTIREMSMESRFTLPIKSTLDSPKAESSWQSLGGPNPGVLPTSPQ